MNDTQLTYAGIGSRKAPETALRQMRGLGKRLAELGLKLSSGGADGPDTAFEQGCDAANGEKQIFIPWNGFNERQADNVSVFAGVSDEALALAAQYHPNFAACKRGGRALHARNGYQVLTLDLSTPIEMVICWTDKGSGGGGTGQAIRIARAYNVPVYDLFFPDTMDKIKAHLQRLNLI